MSTEQTIDQQVAVLWQALRPHIGEAAWTVEDAKAKLTKVMERCRTGTVELIGVRDPVLMVSVKELAKIVQELKGPQTWGELFMPTPELPGIDETLTLQHDPKSSIRNLEDLDSEVLQSEA